MSTHTKPSAKRRFIKLSDALFVLALLILAGVSYWIYQASAAHDGLVADIYYQNNLLESVPLSAGQNEREFSYPENPAVVFVLSSDGSIAFKASDCPDQVCVHAGHLHTENAFAACLPNDFLVVLRQADSAPSRPAAEEVDLVN